jgi:hypothetical protein
MPGFWQRWLEIAFILVTVFGVVYALFGTTALFAPGIGPILSGFWPDGVIPADVRGFAMFNFGIAGGLTAGFGLLAWFVARNPVRRGERWGAVALLWSLVLWFVLDSGMSIYSGAPLNVVINGAFLVIGVIPLIALWPHLRAS